MPRGKKTKNEKKVKKGGKTNGLYGSEQDDNDDVESLDEYFSRSEGQDSDGNEKAKKITMYVKYTKYVVVKEAGKVFMEFHLSRRSKSDWDIGWSDGPVGMTFLRDMHAH